MHVLFYLMISSLKNMIYGITVDPNVELKTDQINTIKPLVNSSSKITYTYVVRFKDGNNVENIKSTDILQFIAQSHYENKKIIRMDRVMNIRTRIIRTTMLFNCTKIWWDADRLLTNPEDKVTIEEKQLIALLKSIS